MEDLMRSQQVENILEVARDLLLEFGFVNTKVSDIADETVRIVLVAYPSKVGGAFDLSDAAVQSA